MTTAQDGCVVDDDELFPPKSLQETRGTQGMRNSKFEKTKTTSPLPHPRPPPKTFSFPPNYRTI
jgi:hypothetical protein